MCGIYVTVDGSMCTRLVHIVSNLAVTGILVLKKMVRPRSQAVRIRIRVRLGSGDDMSTSECLGTSTMSGYGRIRSENDLTDQKNFRDRAKQ